MDEKPARIAGEEAITELELPARVAAFRRRLLRLQLVLCLPAGAVAVLAAVPFALPREPLAWRFALWGLAWVLAAPALVLVLAVRDAHVLPTTKRQLVPRERVPALHDFVDQVLARTDGSPFAGLALEWDGWASLVALQERDLLLGVGLFAVLDREEVSAVIAHEAGHLLDPQDFGLGRAHFGLLQTGLERVPLPRPLRRWLEELHAELALLGRALERRADRVAVAAFGEAAVKRALTTTQLHLTWLIYALLLVQQFADDDGVRVPLMEGFRRFLAEKEKSPSYQELVSLPDEPHHVLNSHPTRRERAGEVADRDTVTVTGSLELLGGEAAAEDLFYELLGKPGLRPVGWDDILQQVLIPSFEAACRGTVLDPQRIGLRELVGLVGDTDALFRLLEPEVKWAPPGHKHRVIAVAAHAHVVLGAIAAGHQPSWRPGTEVFFSRDGRTFRPAHLLGELLQGQMEPSAFLEACEGWLT